MALSVLFFLLPIHLFLCLLGDATSSQLISPPWRSARASTESQNRFRERKGQRDSVFGGGEGIRGLGFGRRGGCHHHDGGGKSKFMNLFPVLPQEDRLRPQFPRTFFPSSGVANASSAESVSQPESREILGLEEREKALKCIGKGFPETKHSLNDTIVCLWSILMKKNREINQQKRQGQVKPWKETRSISATRTVSVPTRRAYPATRTAYSSKEVVSPRAYYSKDVRVANASSAESVSQNKSRDQILGLEYREKALQCNRKQSLNDIILCLDSISLKADREINQQKRQGQAAPWNETRSVSATRTVTSGTVPATRAYPATRTVSVPATTAYPRKEVVSGQTRSFPSEEEEKPGRLHEDPAAPWTDWLRSLFLHH